MTNQALLTQRLTDALAPTHLSITDNSHLHAHHKTNTTGGSHFKITIASPQFKNQSKIAQHRLIYQALAGLIPEKIHAIEIKIISR